MKNSIADLNNILFEQIERLNDDECMSDTKTAKMEIARAKAIEGISEKIIENASLTFEAFKYKDRLNVPAVEMPETLRIAKDVK